MKFGIDKFIGLWESEDGYILDISKTSDTSASVSFYDPSGELVASPYFNNKTTIKMPASYDDDYGEFTIVLWEEGKGFELELHHEGKHDLDEFKRESLIPAITMYEEDTFLDKYYKLFGNLKDFSRIHEV